MSTQDSFQALNELFGMSYQPTPDNWGDVDVTWEQYEPGWDLCIKLNTGRKYPLSHRQAISRGVKANHHRCDGEHNSRAKRWRIVYCDGRTEDISALKHWARERGYSEGGLRAIIRGKNTRGISGYKKIIREVIEL